MLFEQLNEKILEMAQSLISRDDMKERKISLREVLITKSARPLVRVYLDKENGVNISDLAYFHKEFEILLDAEDLIKSSYTLEVSSPGEEKKR
ncbi:TPA: hypothetical protein DCW38_05115 [candidate division WOR-3 bacterium]|jgi:ribosome maturation factor RimP|uniref:Ribosome maturation factor RimP N-terminal domain-containing protein n=1 Tax=candidate division WOR-3 bacterium TaxID=2052148 RepID=A0A350HAH9_UNCW3|nr:hypothetical protein [candidate division WOR-3 bacterium]